MLAIAPTIDAGRARLHARSVDATWQWGVVIAIEIAALAYLARKLFGRAPDARPRAKKFGTAWPGTLAEKKSPDVPVGSLVRKPRRS